MSRLLLVIDTATRTGVLGLAEREGRLIARETWATGHRHGEELLSRLANLLAQAGAEPSSIGAIGVGIGPGSFTGLRIGLATAKTLAYGLGVPLVGISTAQALALAASGGVSGEYTVTLPAGAHDRYVARIRVDGSQAHEIEPAQLTTGGPADESAGILVAVDFDPAGVPSGAAATGERAVGGLARGLARLAAAAFAAGKSADVAELVPAYVALPRGITEVAASVEWSPDLR